LNIKREIMRDICSSTLADAVNIFLLNKEMLSDCKFIFSTEGEVNFPEFILQKTFDENDSTGVYSIFKYSKILVLDDFVLNEMRRNGAVTYRVDYSVSLDSMAVTYIYRLLQNQNCPKNFNDVFLFLAQKEINFDPIPYIIENIQDLHIPKHEKSVFETIKAYEILKTIDVECLKQNNIIRSTNSDDEIEKESLLLLEDMKNLKNNPMLKDTFRMQKFKYCLLMKMVLIQLDYPNKSSGYKLTEFVEFCESVFSTMFLREIVIAKAYFDNGQNLSFFGKVQKKRDDLLVTLKNMSWDLYHISRMEESISIPPEGEARYFFPSFLTFDKRLVEIIKLYSLKAIGFTTDGKEVVPAYDMTNFNEAMDPKYGINKFFEDSAINSREERRNKNLNIESIISNLEDSIRYYM